MLGRQSRCFNECQTIHAFLQAGCC